MMKKISQMQTKRALVRIKDTVIPVEVVDTDYTRGQGLQGRKELNGGMLFVHPSSVVASYWMRDTEIPLSIAFLDEDGTIVHTADLEPNDETPCTSPEPVRFALEVPRGLFKDKSISVGDTVTVVTAANNFDGLRDIIKEAILKHQWCNEPIPNEVYDYVGIEGIVENPSTRLIKGFLSEKPSTIGEAVTIRAKTAGTAVTLTWVEKWYEALKYAVNLIKDTIRKGEQLSELE